MKIAENGGVIRRLLASSLLAAFTAAAFAAPVSFRASGVFNAADGSLSPQLVGKAFTFDIAYDTTTEGNTGSWGSFAYGYYDLDSFHATIDGVGSDLDFFPTLSVIKDAGHDSVEFSGAVYRDGYVGYLFNLKFVPNAPLASIAIPSDPLALAANSTVTASMRDIEGYGEYFQNGQATASRVSMQAVPEPASLAALAVGGMGLLRRRRRA